VHSKAEVDGGCQRKLTCLGCRCKPEYIFHHRQHPHGCLSLFARWIANGTSASRTCNWKFRNRNRRLQSDAVHGCSFANPANQLARRHDTPRIACREFRRPSPRREEAGRCSVREASQLRYRIGTLAAEGLANVQEVRIDYGERQAAHSGNAVPGV